LSINFSYPLAKASGNSAKARTVKNHTEPLIYSDNINFLKFIHYGSWLSRCWVLPVKREKYYSLPWLQHEKLNKVFLFKIIDTIYNFPFIAWQHLRAPHGF
jgi:hypothetical protein